jgi:hypothetical protein
MDINIGLTRKEFATLAADLTAHRDDPNPDVTLYGKMNSTTDEEVIVHFNCEDMDADRAGEGLTVLVDVDE